MTVTDSLKNQAARTQIRDAAETLADTLGNPALADTLDDYATRTVTKAHQDAPTVAWWWFAQHAAQSLHRTAETIRRQQ